jgi:hypothetical protein
MRVSYRKIMAYAISSIITGFLVYENLLHFTTSRLQQGLESTKYQGNIIC